MIPFETSTLERHWDGKHVETFRRIQPSFFKFYRGQHLPDSMILQGAFCAFGHSTQSQPLFGEAHTTWRVR